MCEGQGWLPDPGHGAALEVRAARNAAACCALTVPHNSSSPLGLREESLGAGRRGISRESQELRVVGCGRQQPLQCAPVPHSKKGGARWMGK